MGNERDGGREVKMGIDRVRGIEGNEGRKRQQRRAKEAPVFVLIFVIRSSFILIMPSDVKYALFIYP